MGWLQGKSTGNHRFSHEIWDVPVFFPSNQSIDTMFCFHQLQIPATTLQESRKPRIELWFFWGLASDTLRWNSLVDRMCKHYGYIRVCVYIYIYAFINIYLYAFVSVYVYTHPAFARKQKKQRRSNMFTASFNHVNIAHRNFNATMPCLPPMFLRMVRKYQQTRTGDDRWLGDGLWHCYTHKKLSENFTLCMTLCITVLLDATWIYLRH